MQRYVLICRHAEANDPYPLQPDFERELTKQGVHQAHQAGQWLRDNFKKVDAILASPSNRTRATATIVASRLYFDEVNIKYDPDLYNAREAHLFTSLGKLPNEVKQVVVVSHNPGITQLCRALTQQRIAYLEPSQIIAVSIKLQNWEEVHINEGTIYRKNF